MGDTVQVLAGILRRLILAASMFGAVYAAIEFLTDWDAQRAVPKQAAVAGYMLAWVAGPYSLARSFSGAFYKRAE